MKWLPGFTPEQLVLHEGNKFYCPLLHTENDSKFPPIIYFNYTRAVFKFWKMLIHITKLSMYARYTRVKVILSHKWYKYSVVPSKDTPFV